MTPQEKAKELVGKMRFELSFPQIILADHASKQCALIAVDLAIEIYNGHGYLEHTFWNQVKQEIEKL